MKMETREAYLSTDFKVRASEDGKERYLEGYFIRFNEETELWPGVYEEVALEAVTQSLEENDIRCLFNHDSSVVLGRTSNGTLELSTDSKGVFGKVKINNNDKQAMDILARIERGDIDACSFGFWPIKEETVNKDDGTVKFVLREIDLKEVSPVTFPAYPTTSIQARKKDYAQHKERKLNIKKDELRRKLNGTKTDNA